VIRLDMTKRLPPWLIEGMDAGTIDRAIQSVTEMAIALTEEEREDGTEPALTLMINYARLRMRQGELAELAEQLDRSFHQQDDSVIPLALYKERFASGSSDNDRIPPI